LSSRQSRTRSITGTVRTETLPPPPSALFKVTLVGDERVFYARYRTVRAWRERRAAWQRLVRLPVRGWWHRRYLGGIPVRNPWVAKRYNQDERHRSPSQPESLSASCSSGPSRG